MRSLKPWLLILILRAAIAFNVSSEYMTYSAPGLVYCEIDKSDMYFTIKMTQYSTEFSVTPRQLFLDPTLQMSVNLLGLQLVKTAIPYKFHNYKGNASSVRILVNEAEPPFEDDEWRFDIQTQFAVIVLPLTNVVVIWRINVIYTQWFIAFYELAPQPSVLTISSVDTSNDRALDPTCMSVTVNTDCYHLFKDSFIRLVSVQYSTNEADTMKPFSLKGNNCAFADDVVPKPVLCSSDGLTLVFDKVIDADNPLKSFTVKVCSVLNPPIGRQQKVILELVSPSNVTYATGEFEITSKNPSTVKTVTSDLNSQVVGSPFSLEVIVALKSDYTSTDPFIVSIEMPAILIEVSNLHITVEDKKTRKKVIFTEVARSINSTFQVEVRDLLVDYSSGLVIILSGFHVPDIALGSYSVRYKFYDSLGNKLLTDPFSTTFAVKAALPNQNEMQIKSPYRNTKTDCLIRFYVPLIDDDGEIDLVIGLGPGLSMESDDASNLVVQKLLIFDRAVISSVLRSITLERLQLNNFSSFTYFEVSLTNVLTSSTFLIYKIEIVMYSKQQVVWRRDAQYSLDFIDFSIRNIAIVPSEDKWRINIRISFKNRTPKDYHLRIRLSRSFSVDFGQQCLTIIGADTNDLISPCENGNKFISDSGNSQTVVLVRRGLDNTTEDKEFTISLETQIGPFVAYREPVEVDIIAPTETISQYQITSTMSNIANMDLNFDCPMNCLRCATDKFISMRCSKCYDSFYLDWNNDCVLTVPSPYIPSNEPKLFSLYLSYYDVITKLLIGYIIVFLSIGLTSCVGFTVFSNQRFRVLKLFAPLPPICLFTSLYLVLIYDVDVYKGELKLSHSTVALVLYWMANAAISAYLVVNMRNSVLTQTRVYFIRFHPILLFVVFSMLGYGAAVMLLTHMLKQEVSLVIKENDYDKIQMDLRKGLIGHTALLFMVSIVFVLMASLEPKKHVILAVFSGLAIFASMMSLIALFYERIKFYFIDPAVPDLDMRLINKDLIGSDQPENEVSWLSGGSENTSFEIKQLENRDTNCAINAWLGRLEEIAQKDYQ